MKQTIAHLAGACAVAALLVGCGKIQKTQECKAFIGKLNASLQEIEKHNATKSTDSKQAAEKIEKLAELYKQLATEVDAMTFNTSQLGDYADEYRTMAAKAADIAGRLSAATKDGEKQKALEIQKEFNSVVEHESKLVETINGFCSAP